MLSHGHNDHTGGLALLAQERELTHVQLVCHPRCLLPRWYEADEIGLPESGAILSLCQYRPSAQPLFLSKNCVFLGEIPVSHSFEQRRPLGRVLLDGTQQPDLLLDDSALAIRTGEGLFIVTGCSHSGICNIVSYACAVCGDSRVAGIIGGFHLPRVNSRVEKTAEFLASLHPGPLYPATVYLLRPSAASCAPWTCGRWAAACASSCNFPKALMSQNKNGRPPFFGGLRFSDPFRRPGLSPCRSCGDEVFWPYTSFSK